MNTDRYFYDPGPLAIGKGLLYALAFFTAVQFENVNDKAYFFGIILYCCGIICDYIELSAYKYEKCPTVRRVSLIISVVVGFVIIFSLAVVYSFEKATSFINLIKQYHIFVNLFLTFFWMLPLGNGLYLAYNSIPSRKNAGDCTRPQYPAGFHVKP